MFLRNGKVPQMAGAEIMAIRDGRRSGEIAKSEKVNQDLALKSPV